MRKALITALLLALPLKAFGSADLPKDEIAPPKENKGVERLNTTAGYEMFKTPDRIKIIVKNPGPNQGLIISRFLSVDWQPAAASSESLPAVKKEKKAQVQAPKGNSRPVLKQAEVKRLEGECYVPDRVEVRSFERYLTLPCVFGTETGSLEVVLSPDPKSGALIGIPKSVQVGNRTYQVVKGVVLRKDGSLNLADEVNRQYLKKILASGALEGFSAGFEAYKEYAQNKNTTTYATYGGTVIQEKSIPANYPLISAVLGAVDGMAKAVQKILQGEMAKIPVLYVVYPKEVVFKGEVK